AMGNPLRRADGPRRDGLAHPQGDRSAGRDRDPARGGGHGLRRADRRDPVPPPQDRTAQHRHPHRLRRPPGPLRVAGPGTRPAVADPARRGDQRPQPDPVVAGLRGDRLRPPQPDDRRRGVHRQHRPAPRRPLPLLPGSAGPGRQAARPAARRV
ncbi:MAG: hypothetical protein AVDCRST_MAG18-2812, partial [uncultured Thermomicrobiales bacterium]